MSEPSERAMEISKWRLSHAHWCPTILWAGNCTCNKAACVKRLAGEIDAYAAEMADDERGRILEEIASMDVLMPGVKARLIERLGLIESGEWPEGVDRA